MPRPKKGSPEAKAWAAKMQATRAANKKLQDSQDSEDTAEEKSEASPEPQTSFSNEERDDLLRRLAEVETMLQKSAGSQQPLERPQVGSQGLVGTMEKYRTDPKYYPDPRQRLTEETRLQPFAFSQNYELEYSVSVSSYRTIDGINAREPKFSVKLIRIMRDEFSGEDTGKRYVINQLIFHEDPDTALTLAQERGIDLLQYAEKDFLDEMRYLRVRDWLLDCFFPPPPAANKKTQEVVIGNRLVEVFTASNEVGEKAPTIPFSQLKSKL